MPTTPARALAITDVQSLTRAGPIDIAFVTLKSFDTGWATMLIREHLAPDGFVVSLQNCITGDDCRDRGLGPGCRLHRGEDRGRVDRPWNRAPRCPWRIRAYRVPCGRTARPHYAPIERVCSMLAEIDSSKTTSNLWGERWSKLCANAMSNGTSAASGLGSNGCARDRWLMIRIGGEAAAIGRAHGYDLKKIGKFTAEVWIAASLATLTRGRDRTRHAGRLRGRQRGQSAVDGSGHRQGPQNEIDFINGFIVAKGREIGIEAPANQALAEAVRVVEAGRSSAAPSPLHGLLKRFRRISQNLL